MDYKLVLVLVLAIVGYRAVDANEAEFLPCSEVDASKCTVESVNITPCKNPKSCLLKKGTNSSIVFDYTPNFAASKLKGQVYWTQGSDTALAGMETDACKFTPCPVEAGKKQQYSYQLYLGKKLPQGQFAIKWKLWNDEQSEETTEVCCFITNIELRR